MVKNGYKKNLQDFYSSCRFVYIYSKWDVTANRYIVPKNFVVRENISTFAA